MEILIRLTILCCGLTTGFITGCRYSNKFHKNKKVLK